MKFNLLDCYTTKFAVDYHQYNVEILFYYSYILPNIDRRNEVHDFLNKQQSAIDQMNATMKKKDLETNLIAPLIMTREKTSILINTIVAIQTEWISTTENFIFQLITNRYR